MDFWHNPFWKGMGTTMKAIPNGVYKLGENAAKGMLLYAGGAALGGALGGEAGAGAAGAGEGVDASTGLFAGESANAGTSTYGTTGGGPTGMPLPGTESVTNAMMRQRMPGMSQPYKHQQPPRVQPNFVFPSPIVSVMPKDTYGSY